MLVPLFHSQSLEPDILVTLVLILKRNLQDYLFFCCLLILLRFLLKIHTYPPSLKGSIPFSPLFLFTIYLEDYSTAVYGNILFIPLQSRRTSVTCVALLWLI